MAWTPNIAVLTARAIPDTLLTFFETNQADALTWAGGANLKKFKSFANSVIESRAAKTPVYPSIAFLDDTDAQELSDDLIGGAYAFTFEVSIQNRNPDQAVTDARIYAKAICSMIANCELKTGTGAVKAVLDRIEIGFEEIQSNEKQNDFLQVFQVRGTVQLLGSIHA